MEQKDRIILLSYVNRSGSTFLSMQLGRHNDVFVCTEAEILVEKFLEDPSGQNTSKRNREILSGCIKTDRKLGSWGIEKEVFNNINDSSINLEVFVSVLKAYRDKIKPSATVILFKAERLISLFERIKKTPLNGTAIHFLAIIRDVRAVYASQKKTPMLPGNKPMSASVVKTSLQWNGFVRTASALEKKGLLYLVNYERMMRNQNDEMNNVTRFLRLNFSIPLKEDSDLYTRLLPEHRNIHAGILLAADPLKISGWKKSLCPREIFYIQALSAKWMKKFGYKREKLPLGTGLYLLFLPLLILEQWVRKVFKKVLYRITCISVCR